VLLAPVILGDSQEVKRHGITVALQLRIGLLLLSGWLLDEWLARRDADGVTAEVTAGTAPGPA
jgi:hypothetical protein